MKIHTGSDGNHVTIWERSDGVIVATVDERTTRRERAVVLLDNPRWIGCYGSDDCAICKLPPAIVPALVLGAM